jgi:hypothetical protein
MTFTAAQNREKQQMDVIEEFNTQWAASLAKLFPEGIPDADEWRDHQTIVSVLNAMGFETYACHLFLPQSGGFDLLGAEPAKEQGCIDINAGGYPLIIAPDSLRFERCDKTNLSSSYFRLETKPLRPSLVHQDHEPEEEEVVDLGDGKYVSNEIQDSEEDPLPDESRLVTRYLRPGVFVLFSKGSPYNLDRETYDGRHGMMSGPEFRQYVARWYRGR